MSATSLLLKSLHMLTCTHAFFWRRSSETHTSYAACAVAAVPTLEVLDTSEIKSLQKLLAKERIELQETRKIAKAERRKVLKVNCELDIKKIDKILPWTELVLKDPNRTW